MSVNSIQFYTIVGNTPRYNYVDNVCGADQEHEANELYTVSRENLSHGSFNLRKFATNAARLTEQHPEVLGVCWNVKQGEMIFTFDALLKAPNQIHPTKRSVISMIGRPIQAL